MSCANIEKSSDQTSMATSSDQTSARFRSATEFPQTIKQSNRLEADALYEEMRDCLIFTNRSRAQLLRRNTEHKQSALQLRLDVERLQGLINQLTQEKQQLTQNNQLIVADLEQEISSMTTHLDRLSTAFDDVADIETMPQTQWSFLTLPGRFFKLLRTVKEIVLSWREEQPKALADHHPSASLGPGETEVESDRRDRPQMFTDPASVGRSLLDK